MYLNTTQGRRRKRRYRQKFLSHHHPGEEKDTIILEVMTLKLINSHSDRLLRVFFLISFFCNILRIVLLDEFFFPFISFEVRISA